MENPGDVRHQHVTVVTTHGEINMANNNNALVGREGEGTLGGQIRSSGPIVLVPHRVGHGKAY